MAETEADTCRKFVVPMLQRAGWDDAPHAINEQRTFTDGRIMRRLKRGGQGRAAVVVPNGTLFGDGIAARINFSVSAHGTINASGVGPRERISAGPPRFAESRRGVD